MVGDVCGVGITVGVDVDSVSGILHPSLLSKKSCMYVCMYVCRCMVVWMYVSLQSQQSSHKFKMPPHPP